MKHVWGRAELHIGFWREGDYLEDPGIDESIILQCIFKK
jgi:hypothetical protein